jgi:hypothetical protein
MQKDRKRLKNSMRIVIIFCLLILTLTIKAQKTKLDFEPKGLIVLFNFEGLKIYTDTTELFKYIPKNRDTLTKARLRKIIFEENNNIKKDTISFFGHYFPLYDSNNEKKGNKWDIQWTIYSLTENNRLKIIDSSNKIIKTIKIKKLENKTEFSYIKIYIDKKTNKELFRTPIITYGSEPTF